MPDETEKIIQEKFKNLPRDIQQAILSPHFEGNIDYIRNKNALLIDKQVPLKNEVLLLIMGFTDPGDFSHNLTESLGIHPEEANLIVREVYSRIIEPIENSLIAYTRIRAGEEAETNKIAIPTKIESVSAVGPDVVIKTSSRIALDEGIQGFRDDSKVPPPSNLPTGSTPPISATSKEELHEFMPTLAKKLSATAPSPVPPSQPVSSRPLVMPKSAEEAAAFKSAPPTSSQPISPAPQSVNSTQKAGGPAEVTSALAAEIGNLLNKKELPKQGEVPTPKPPTVNIPQPPKPLVPSTQTMPTATKQFFPPKESSKLPTPFIPPAIKTSPAPIAPLATPPSGRVDTPVQLPQNSNLSAPPAPQITQNVVGFTAPQKPLRPEDKLAGATQNPRVEVEMVKTPASPTGVPPPQARPSDGVDPYREAI